MRVLVFPFDVIWVITTFLGGPEKRFELRWCDNANNHKHGKIEITEWARKHGKINISVCLSSVPGT